MPLWRTLLRVLVLVRFSAHILRCRDYRLSFFFRSDYAEATIFEKFIESGWLKSSQNPPSKSLDEIQPGKNFGERLPKGQKYEVKPDMTNNSHQKWHSKSRHRLGIENYGFIHGEAWAGLQNLSFCGRPGEAHHIARIRLWSRKGRPLGDSGVIKLLNESHEASPAYPLKDFMPRILSRKFCQVIGSNQTQQKYWKGLSQEPTSQPTSNT